MPEHQGVEVHRNHQHRHTALPSVGPRKTARQAAHSIADRVLFGQTTVDECRTPDNATVRV
jgi:hypothetical protein